MIIISWNVRGLNKSHKQREVRKFLLKNKVDMIACLETRVRKQNAKDIQRKTGNEWKIEDNYEYAPNGRIWLMWKEVDVNVTVLEKTEQLIHCYVQDKNSAFTCYITYVYGLHTVQHRKSLWGNLKNVQLNDPWLIIGDFNSVLNVDDRISGNTVQQVEVVDFQNCIEDIGVGQITKRGGNFTWCNKRDAEIRIYSHIDWAFGNAEWFNLYTGIEAHYMLPGCSDHTPIMISTEVQKMKVNRPYRLLTTVMKQVEYKEIVQRIWKQRSGGDAMNTIQGKLNEDYFNAGLIDDERKCLADIEKWEAVQEQILRQKSRATWIQVGDQNTKYFHACEDHRTKANSTGVHPVLQAVDGESSRPNARD
ncbi:PREDICTED: uncharacterized protein LOC109224197 [Nicotiana attenuata]|uniref:uncharacterized protein LOC109224197 n=1 Tax=Nicotiana attenuata TaxID=49451 RepID=UPI00090590C6|nr:PREDICTED: uncharacterized protein LOC109224197 [Nicotiana attenuata]